MVKTNRKKQGIFGITRPQAGTFLTDDELAAKQIKGTRFVKNEQTVLGGQYSGIMKSGKSVELSGDGVVKIPINYDGSTVQGSVAVFNFDTKEFEQESNLPLSTHYELKDGTYGTICKLHTNQFSADDIAAFNENPELLLEWYWGDKTIPSGIIMGTEDKVYVPVDGYYLDLDSIANPNLKFKLDIPSDGETISFEVITPYSTFYVDWGDGTIDSSLTHIYTNAGSYTVSVLGNCERISMKSMPYVTSILNFGLKSYTSCHSMFEGCNPTDAVFGIIDTSNVISMYKMMYNWSSITTPPDLINFNTSKVTNMQDMMYNWSSITTPPDLTSFDTSNVTNMSSMMRDWKLITTPPDLTSFDTSKVTSMSLMLRGWSSMTTTPDLSNFDTSNVTSMSSMMRDWRSTTTPPDLSSFDTSNVINMEDMMSSWNSMTTTPDLSSFNTSNVTAMNGMMRDWKLMTTPPDLSNFDTSKVTNMAHMMRSWSSMGEIGNIGIENFNISSLTTASDMLSGTTVATATYDKILINWEAQPHQPNVEVHFGNSKYTAGGEAETARNNLIADGWIIHDEGAA